MKKILSLILLIALLFSFASCKQDKPDGEAQSESQTQSETQAPENLPSYVDLSDYRVVIPKDADAITKYASENFVSLVEERLDIDLTVVDDTAEETELEILIGETNRDESDFESVLADGEYYLFVDESKIVMQGYGIYIGAACGDFINKYTSLADNGLLEITDLPKEATPLKFEFAEKATSVIFMIGDGMGENHIKMAEYKDMIFYARGFTSIGKSVTRSQSVIDGKATYTDSAASGTAMATGYKTVNGYIGLDKSGVSIKNVRELAFENGAKTAVITTDLITGATPSSYLCHSLSRNNTDDLQAQIDALVNDKKVDYVAGDVGDELTSHIKTALSQISADGSSFFMMVEEGLIDKASHSKQTVLATNYVIRFNDAIAYTTQFVLCHPDVALIVTADHETGDLTQSIKRPNYFFFQSSNHTNQDVPVFAIGAGTEIFNGQRVENIELARFCAGIYSSEQFGQTEPVPSENETND